MTGAGPRLLLPILALLSGCAEEGAQMGRLTEALAVQTTEVAGPSVTAALVMGGLAVELCVSHNDNIWSEVEAGDSPPLTDLLVRAMGEPTVNEVEVGASGGLQVTLNGVRVMDRDQSVMRFSTAPANATFSFEAVVLDGRHTDLEGGGSEPFGRVAFDVQADCSLGRNRVEGSARWTDLEDRTQSVSLPADQDLSAGVAFMVEVPYFPTTGNIAWASRIDGQDRNLTTFDAADGQVDSGSLPVMHWPAWVWGTDWTTEGSIDISP